MFLTQEDAPPNDHVKWREWVKDKFRNVSQQTNAIAWCNGGTLRRHDDDQMHHSNLNTTDISPLSLCPSVQLGSRSSLRGPEWMDNSGLEAQGFSPKGDQTGCDQTLHYPFPAVCEPPSWSPRMDEQPIKVCQVRTQEASANGGE